jgi:hypothetical protein
MSLEITSVLLAKRGIAMRLSGHSDYPIWPSKNVLSGIGIVNLDLRFCVKCVLIFLAGDARRTESAKEVGKWQ